MGLDLYHAHPAAATSETIDYFALSELAGAPALIQKHQYLITEVIEETDFFTIYIFENKRESDNYFNRLNNKEDKCAYLIGAKENLAAEIAVIESENILPVEDAMIFDYQIGYIRITYPLAVCKSKVLHFKEVGYQRKGMLQPFYEEFINCKAYFKKTDVIKAATYLDVKRRPETSKYFKEAFIDNFVEGESIFFGSW